MAPFEIVPNQGNADYLLYPPHRREFQVLRDWLVAEAGTAGQP